MSLEKVARLVHKIIALLRLAANEEVSSKEVEQTPGVLEEITSYFDENIGELRTIARHRDGL